MKLRNMVLVLSLVLVTALAAGCGSGGESAGTNAGNANNVEDVLQNQIDAAEGKSETTEAETETTTKASSSIDFYSEGAEEETPDIYSTEGVDIDLTQMSGTMLYSQVNYMMYKPEEFVGKTVKVPGTFSAVYSEEAGRYYFGCLVADQAACCVLGVEFELPETYSYPEDYPAEGENITVFGTFDTYQEGQYTYCVLRNAQLVE